MSSSREIVVVSFPHPGHLFPAVELCNKLAERNYDPTLLFPSSTPTSSLALHPRIRVELYSLSDSINFSPPVFEESILALMDKCFGGGGGRDESSLPPPLCAVVDEMVSWLIDHFYNEYRIPAVSLFTSSATSAALEHAMSRASPMDGSATPGSDLSIPGLPEEMALTPSLFASRRGPPGGPEGRDGGPHGPPMDRGPPDGPEGRDGRPHGPPRGRGPPSGPGGRGGGPHGPPMGRGRGRGGGPRRSLASSERATGILLNTCVDLERPFIDYMAKEAGKPVWGVGPLVRVPSSAGVDVAGKEVIEWLDSKPRGSVVYVAFGSLVSPSDAELAELAAGLEESNRPFIWVVQTGSRQHDSTGRPVQSGPRFPADLAARVGTRGLVVKGWAPQLAVLNHPSTGGYVCHCGWNSTLEALGSGVPMLTWPVRGDQFLNAKLVTDFLKVGIPLKEADVEVKRGGVAGGIERLVGDVDMRKRAESVRCLVGNGGFPDSSSESLDRFLEFVNGQRK